jgi:hypothetical protein
MRARPAAHSCSEHAFHRIGTSLKALWWDKSGYSAVAARYRRSPGVLNASCGHGRNAVDAMYEDVANDGDLSPK